MCSRVYFYRGNEKQTRTNLKNINVVLLRMSNSLTSTVYVWYIVPSAEPPFFLGRRGANSKRGAYLKLGAKNPDPLRPGNSHVTGTGMRKKTIRIKPLNEINLGMAQDFFDKGDHMSSNTV